VSKREGRVFDVTVIVIGIALTSLMLTDTTYVEVAAVSAIALSLLLLLICVMNRMSQHMVRRIAEVKPDGTHCVSCGQTVSDLDEHRKKSHGQSAR
jgi:Na+-transporting methylmalonyl-CoA/oxaloacetate decarboxylase gamma subunit